MRTLNIAEYCFSRMGFRYMVNLDSKEIHDLYNRSGMCHIEKIEKRVFVPKFIMLLLLKFGFNGCYWCNNKYDTDKKKAQ